MLAAMGLFAKKLSLYFGVFEVTFFRSFIAGIVLLLWLAATGRLDLLKTQRPKAHFFRGTIGTLGILSGIWAISLMPLSESTLLLFTSPLFVVLLSYPVLGERVGIYRLSAVALGFFGVFITISPSSAVHTLPLLGVMAGLMWGFFSGCVDVCLRWIGRTENSTTTVFYFMLYGSVVTGIHWPFAQPPQEGHSLEITILALGLGLTGLLSLLSKTQSYRYGEATMIAPIMYTMILWTMIFDYVFWNKEPTLNVILGAALIISSSLFIIYRENALEKHKKKPDALTSDL